MSKELDEIYRLLFKDVTAKNQSNLQELENKRNSGKNQKRDSLHKLKLDDFDIILNEVKAKLARVSE
jgi:hypothetical protein